MPKELITVFTPVYNRRDLIARLYNSLLLQTDKSFIWLIIDDGSTDGTGKAIESFINEKKLNIEYIYTENHGKYIAHNTAVKLCRTELFVCVDSDDVLMPCAIERITEIWQTANKTPSICGIVSPKKIADMSYMTNPPKISNLNDLYNKGYLVGETMLVFRTDVLREFLFPEIDGEKFMSESVIYLKIDKKYKLLVLNEYLYEGEYQEDGLTKNSSKLYDKNPRSILLMYKTTAAYQTDIVAAAKAYGSYLAWKKFKKLYDFKIDVKVPLLIKIGGMLLRKHYLRLFSEK